MNFLTIRAWENADPYEGKCTEDRCVNAMSAIQKNMNKNWNISKSTQE